MKYIVYYTAVSRGGGGETILDQYFKRALEDAENEWWFIVSLEKYKEQANERVHVVYVEIPRGSLIKTYYSRKKYENSGLKKLVKKIQPDGFICMQNTAVSGITCKQTVYLHQPLQFSPVKYRFLRREERGFAFRQRVICPLIRRSLRKADRVIVQTNWMKESVSKWAAYPSGQIVVETPAAMIPDIPATDKERANNHFFFPASGYLHKNHRVIVDACRILKNRGFNGYRVQFTLSANDSGPASRLYEEIRKEELPIEFIGHLDKPTLFEKYQTEIMLFPSYVETFGLPLLESKSVGGAVIASNLPFAHEILDGYSEATFVNWDDADGWADAMMNQSEKE